MSQSSSYSTHKLSSGLTVLLVPMQSVKSATVLAMVHAGSRFEKEQWAGISHFLEHMVFKGTEKYTDAKMLSSTIDAIGAEFNAFTSKDYTGYYVKAASEHMDTALDVVSDMLLTPKLRTEDLEREKGVIIEELHMYEDTPHRHIGDIFEQVMFAGTSLGRDIIGTVETIRSMDRKTFTSYLHDWYGLGNVTLAVVGDSSLVGEKLLKKIESYFSKSKDERKDGQRVYAGKSVYAKDHKIHVEYKKTEQAHFILGFPALQRKDPDKYALTVLSALFGGYMSSRLFTEVREKRGLCYYVHSDVDAYEDAGIFAAAAGVDKNRIDEAVEVVNGEFYHLLDEKGPRKISEEEVKRAKDHLIGATILGMEDSQNLAIFYAKKQTLEKETVSLESVLENIKAVTLDDVMRVAHRIVDGKDPYFAVIGPYEKADRFEKILVKA